MPQLMPLYWMFSILIPFMFFFSLMLIYGMYMNKSMFNYKKKLIFLEKWFW